MYLNSGKDVETAEQLMNAIDSLGGVPGAQTILCDLVNVADSETLKWEGISFINNFYYCKDEIRTWKEYGIGSGKLRKLTEFNLPQNYPLPKLNVLQEGGPSQASFVGMKTRQKTKRSSANLHNSAVLHFDTL